MAQTRKADILVIKQPGKGRDMVIGDVHANHAVLEQYLKKLNPQDRLFILGDLFDKGVDNLAVVQLLQDKKYRDRVFIIRGNHDDNTYKGILGLELLAFWCQTQAGPEEDWIDSMEQMLERLREAKSTSAGLEAELGRPLDRSTGFENSLEVGVISLRALMRETRPDQDFHWLIDLFLKELKEGQIRMTEQGPDYHKESSKIFMLQKFLEPLPYIIVYQAGPVPFILVHADMPFSDEELEKRIKAGKGLSVKEIEYAILAREKKGNILFSPDTGRHANSILTLVGHEIVSESSPAVRAKTNTINLDNAAFLNKVFVALNLLTGEAELSQPTRNPQILTALVQVNQHLKAAFGKKAGGELGLESKLGDSKAENLSQAPVAQPPAKTSTDLKDKNTTQVTKIPPKI